MSLSSLSLILVSVTLSALAQIAFKFGVLSVPGEAARNFLGPFASLATPGVLTGFALYGFGTILWLTALERVDLSQAYPFVGVGFALTTLAGWWLFGDHLSPMRFAGIVLIIGGIVMVAKG